MALQRTRAEARFIAQLKAEAKARKIPIDATSWQHLPKYGITELTVTSREKPYMCDLDPLDITESQRSRTREHIIDAILQDIALWA